MSRPVRTLVLALATLAATAIVAAAHVSTAPVSSAPQREPQVGANLRQAVLKLGAETVLEVWVDGTLDAELGPLPRVDGLELVAPRRASTREGVSFDGRNRTVVREIRWAVAVRPTATGEYTIPEIPVTVQGRPRSTPPTFLTVVEDLRGQELGFLEIDVPHERLVEGQPVVAEVRFGWLAEISQQIDHVDLSLPWWGSLPGVLQEPLRAPAGTTQVRVPLNSRYEVLVEQRPLRTRDGKPFLELALRVELLPTRSGRLEFPTSFLAFGETVRRSDPATGRMTRARETYYARAEELALEVEPLPAEGQPLDYGGAIGTLELRASADARDVRVGDSIKLTVDVTGDGNLDYFTPPDLSSRPGFEGFRYFGMTEEKRPGLRRLVYDLAPLGPEVEALPPLTLPVFDPEAWAYEELATEPIPIRVRPLDDPEALDGVAGPTFEEDVRGVRTEALAPNAPQRRAPSDRALGGAALGLLFGWVALRTALRTGGRSPAEVLERSRARALRRLSKALSQALDGEDDLRAFAAFLGARTGEPVAAWIGRDVRAWAAAGGGEGLGDYAREELRRILRALEAACYGGARRVPRDELLQSARELLEDGL